MDSLPLFAPEHNPEKCCIRCKQLLPATSEFFTRDKQRPDGLYSYCKDCRQKAGKSSEARAARRAYNQAYYHDNPENRERILAQRKENYHSDPEVRQKALEYNKLPEVREYQRTYLKEYNRRPEIKERDREARQIAKRNRRAHAKEIAGTYTREQIQDLLIRQKRKCYYCRCKFEKRDGKFLYHVDHTFPINRVVGMDIPANSIDYLVLACPSCNHRKSDKFPWEFPEGGRLL